MQITGLAYSIVEYGSIFIGLVITLYLAIDARIWRSRARKGRTGFYQHLSLAGIVVAPVLVLGAISFGFWFFNAHQTVGDDEVGVLHRDGKAVALLAPGHYTIDPSSERLDQIYVGMRDLTNVDISGPNDNTKPLVVTTADGKLVLTYHLDFQILPTKALEIHQKFGTDWQDQYVKKTVVNDITKEAQKHSTQELVQDPSILKTAVLNMSTGEFSDNGILVASFSVARR